MTARANVVQKIKKMYPTESIDSLAVDQSQTTETYDKSQAKSVIGSMAEKN